MDKILLIDDDKEFNALVKEYLEYEGFNVVCAFDGKQGLAMVYQEEPDLVITDIIMPVMEGVEFLFELRKNPPAKPTRLIAISGGGHIASNEYLDTTIAMGADDIFNKPVNLEMLVEKIRKLLS